MLGWTSTRWVVGFAVTKIVYIISAGHSGSTLLDLIVGTLPNTFSTGELTYLPWQLYRCMNTRLGAERSRQELCSCQSRFDVCPVWKDVLSRVSVRVGFNIYDKPFRFKISLLADQRYTGNDHSIRAVWGRVQRAAYWLSINRPLLRPMANVLTRAYSRPCRNNLLLADAIGDSQHAGWVVDSSKSIFRLRLLHSAAPERVRAVLLWRDPRGVAASAKKLGGDPLVTAAGWTRIYQRALQWACRRAPSICWPVAYEDICSDAVAVRTQVARFLRLPSPESSLEIVTTQNHLVAGNVLRHKGPINIRADRTWQAVLTPAEAALVQEITSPVLEKLRQQKQRAEQEALQEELACSM